MVRSLRAVLHHSVDTVGLMIFVERISIVTLHQTRIADSTTGRGFTYVNASIGFLQDDGEDEPMIDQACPRTILDGILDHLDLAVGIV